MVVDKVKIEREAKGILDKFAKALEKVELASLSKDGGTIFVDRGEEFERVERGISSSDKSDENSKFAAEAEKGFKQRILDNSPDHDDDFIIGEKGSWK
jgi:hypothetical protein